MYVADKSKKKIPSAESWLEKVFVGSLKLQVFENIHSITF